MANGEVNADLLFGLVALQNGFIDQSGLVTAFHGWERDKSQSLAGYLVACGDLDQDRKNAIDALVAEHRQDDGRKLERWVVATLGLHDRVRSELERSLDPDAQETLGLLSTVRLPEASYDPLATTDASDGTISYEPDLAAPSGGRFRILRFHAEGALGAIYVARDEELNRDVALKRMKDEAARDPNCRVRFVREAEITGRLEHPGIVPVYGLCQFPDGRPEYAMRFIEGESLRAAIASHHAGGPGSAAAAALALPNLVRRFLDVCNAISYAHNRGIVHRDIKPANIMLGPYGETLVVDWGLAKSIVRPEEAEDELEIASGLASRSGQGTPTVGAVGTPSYMSPEQASGAIERVSFASDIYGLGATLYCLLTGKAPFQGESDDALSILTKVRSGGFRKPRELKAAVPPALEAVCLKAMALEPEHRYKTARALALDIERWLADAPVSVYREPLLVRLGRWIRRHKPLVAAAAVLVVCVVIGLCVDIVRVGRERAVAEDNFVMAHDAVNRVLSEAAEGPLAAVPQAEELRLHVAKDVSEFNGRLLRQRPRDPAVIREAASTYRKVANIERMLNLPKDAARSYGQSIALGERLLAEFPGDIKDDLNLALTLADWGEFERAEGELQKAEQTCLRGVAIADRLLKQRPNDQNCHLARAMGLLYLAQVQIDLRQTDEARRSAEIAAQIFGGLAGHPTDGARNATLLLLALDNWGKALRQSGHPKQAEQRLRQSIEVAKSVLKQLGAPSSLSQKNVSALLPSISYARSQAELELGLLLASDSERRSLAKDHFELAIAESSSLVEAFPRVTMYRNLLDAATRGRDEIRPADGPKP
jgi:tetratricopeptide (TPR) repeat protein/tRNA A-37 threonylcarbamoyl transferase component Bud32